MTEVFNEHDFWPAFQRDLRSARALILIQSPFLGAERIGKLEPLLKSCVNRRVRICVFVQTPSKKNEEIVIGLAQRLMKMGIHVTFRPAIHEKVGIIDERILLEGSLNYLSHVATSEVVRRWEDKGMAREALVRHRLYKCGSCHDLPVDSMQGEIVEKQLKVIGNSIERRRKTLQISQRQLATSTGVQQADISKIETGAKKARLDTLIRICDRLGLRIWPVPVYALPTLRDIIVDEDS